MEVMSIRNVKSILVPLAWVLAGSACIVAESAEPLGLRQRLRERVAAHAAERPEMKGAVEMAYGGDPLQRLDFWRPREAGSPLVVFVHGGGWKEGDKRGSVGVKALHYLDRGYGFASVNYRLVPAATVEQQAADVAASLAFLVKRADELGIDRSRIVLMGHSAGAHLAALVGTDMSYLQKAGLGTGALRGVIPVDGACYDVPNQITTAGAMMNGIYDEAFGTDKARQLSLSPIHHAAAANVSDFLILHVRRMDGRTQSQALGKALNEAGSRAEVRGFEGSGMEGHLEINRRMGDPSYPATGVVDACLERWFAK